MRRTPVAIAVMIGVVFALSMIGSAYAYELVDTSTANDWKVDWYLVDNGLTHKTYDFQVSNLLDVKRDFDLSAVVEANRLVTNMVISEYKLLPETTWHSVIECSNILVNDTWVEGCVDNGYAETIQTCQWKPAKMGLITHPDSVSADYGAINIPKATGTSDCSATGSKTFRLEFDVPIGSSEYGSSGKFAVWSDGYEYHPFFNSSWTYRRIISVCNIDGSTMPVKYPVMVNSTSFDIAACIDEGKCLADYNDIRVAYYNASGWVEIPRTITLRNYSIWFETQATIGASSCTPSTESSGAYAVYYDYVDAAAPSLEAHFNAPAPDDDTISLKLFDSYSNVTSTIYDLVDATYDGTVNGDVTIVRDASELYGGYVDCKGTTGTNNVDIPNLYDSGLTSTGTISVAWKPQTSKFGVVFGKYMDFTGGTADNFYMFYRPATADKLDFFEQVNNVNNPLYSAEHFNPPDSWRDITAVWDIAGNKRWFFSNNTLMNASIMGNPTPNNIRDFSLCNDIANPDQAVDGQIGWLRIQDVTQNQTINVMANSPPVLSVGAEETQTESTTTTLYIDGTETNRTYAYSPTRVVNSTATTDVPDMTVKIYMNGTLKSSGSGQTSWLTDMAAGLYNITAVNDGNATHSGSSETFWVTIQKAENKLEIYPINMNPTYPTLVGQYCVDNVTNKDCVLYRNGTVITNNTQETLGAGGWNFTTTLSDSQNYTQTSNISYITVSKGLSPVSLCIQNTTNTYCDINNSLVVFDTYPALVNATCTGANITTFGISNVTGGNGTTYTATSGAWQRWSVWEWYYNCVDSGTENYTSASVFNNYYLSKGTPTMNITFNTSSTVVAGTTVLVTCNYPSELPVNLYNNTSVLPSTSYVFDTSGLGGHNYNFTCNSTGSENYTASSTDKILYVGLSGGLIVTTYNEESPASTITFNITAFNTTTSDTAYNQNPYQNNSISGYVTVYYWAEGYPQRNRYVTITANDTEFVTAYLLSSTSGQWVSFYVLDYNGNPIENAMVRAMNFIDTSYQIVDEETTDSSGVASLFLDYDKLHYISIQYAGTWYLENSTLIPSQTLYRYYINPSGTVTNFSTAFTNMNIVISPISLSLPSSTESQDFSCTVTSSDDQLEWYGLNTTLFGGAITFGNVTNSTNGGTITHNYNLTELYESGVWNLTYVCFYKKANFTEMTFSLTYYIYNSTAIGGTGSLENALNEAGTGGSLGIMALGLISLILSGILGGFLGRFNALAGGLVCIVMLGVMWWYFGLFAAAMLQITGIYILIVITTAAVIYLRGGI